MQHSRTSSYAMSCAHGRTAGLITSNDRHTYRMYREVLLSTLRRTHPLNLYCTEYLHVLDHPLLYCTYLHTNIPTQITGADEVRGFPQRGDLDQDVSRIRESWRQGYLKHVYDDLYVYSPLVYMYISNYFTDYRYITIFHQVGFSVSTLSNWII